MKKLNRFVALVAAFTLMMGIVSCDSNMGEPERNVIVVTFPVTVIGGTATPANAEANAIVTIKANAPAVGKEFDRWTTTDGLIFADANAEKTTFSMPEKTVMITATYKDALPIGIKSKPDAVGDIVFNDGSATPYSDGMTLTDKQKAAAIALIFYKGTGLNNGDDTTTSRTLGVGLKHNKSGLAWCTDLANAYNRNITTIQCNANGIGIYPDLELADAKSNDRDGSDNLEQIAAFLTTAGRLGDDTMTAVNYPAFYFAKNYKNVIGSNVSGSDYETGWYLPSLAELAQIYVKGKGDSKVFDIDAASEALGGSKFGISWFWSSSQYTSYADFAFILDFNTGYWFDGGKNGNAVCVCCIRAF